MMRRLIASLSLLFFTPLVFSQTNLVKNPGFEQNAPANLPADWDTVMIGNPVQFSLDTQIKHTGSQSARITASDSARSYFRSAPIPVAPGDKVRAGAWVKFKDVPPSMGTLILIAEWTGPDGKGSDVTKFNVAKRDGTSSDWQFVQGTQTVPEGAANMRLRIGFSYSKGTCWWDDAQVEIENPISMRIDFTDPHITPAMPGLPLTVLNRKALAGPGKVALKVGSDSAEFDVKLTGAEEQKLMVPLPLGKQKDNVAIDARLSISGKQVASASFKGVVPPPLLLPPVMPTHWCIEDGPAKLSGTINLTCAPADLDQAVMTLRVLDSAGATRASMKWSSDTGDLRTGVPTSFDLTIPDAKQAQYKVIVELKGKQAALSAEQPWVVISRRQARVTFNSAGFPVYNGKPIWPMGIFNGGRFQEQGNSGFTISHAYNAVRITPGRDPEDQRAKDFLDQSLANHQMAVFMVPLKLAETGDWVGFRHRIRLFRNHPALLAWDEEEGLARGDWSKQTLATAYKIVHEEDPNHPFMVGDARDVITKMGDRTNFFPVDNMDLGMWWWYPFPLIGRGANALEGEEASAGTTLEPPLFLIHRNTDKPIWIGIQAYKKPGKAARYPTPEEYRLQAYYGIIEGAQGLMWYGGGVTGGVHTNLKEGHWDDLKKLASELSHLNWAWMSPTLQKVEEISPNVPVSFAIKKGPQGTVLIAVNRGKSPVDVTLNPDSFQGRAQVINENRYATFSPTGLKEHFDPYATHVYFLH